MANNESNWISDQVNKIINDVTSKAANQEGMFLPFPYAGIVQPKDYDGQTENGTDFEVANNAYQALKNKLISTPNMTSEAGTLKRAWSTPPKVTIDNGVLKLNGSDEFLKTSEADELRKTLKEMEGNTYNTEKLNEQIEAWNATLAQMSEEYSSITDAMNRMNANLEQSAQNASHHQFTFQDMQKIGASASIGKREDARTTKDKIFVGFEYDDDGNVIEKWVPAEEFFNEFNGLSDDQKRRAYRDLEIGATNGDVAAYSKLMYLQGGSQAGPANVDYDPAGDFWHVIGERVGQGILGIGETVSNFVRPFNLGTITSNLVDYAGSEGRDFMDFAAAVIAPQLYADRYNVGGDSPQNITAEDFWSDKYSTTGGMSSWYRKAAEDYGAMVDWEVAYLSDMTPASTQAASNIGSVAGGVVDFVGSLYAMARGGQMNRKFNQLQVEKANQMFAGSKYFMPVGQIFIKNSGVKINQKGTPIVEGGKLTGWAAGETVAKGVVREIPYGGIYVPKVLMNISPKLTQFIEEVASSLTEVQFLRDAQNFINKDGTTILQFGRPSATGEIIYGAPKTFVDGKVIQGTKDYLAKLGGEGAAATNELSNIVNYSTTYELLKTLENKGTWRGISKGLQTAQSLSTMFGFSAVRAADEYFQRVEAGEEIGDMTSFVIAQTAKNAAFGAGLMGLGAGIKAKFFKNAAQNSNIPAVEYTREFYSKDFGEQKGWYSPTESTGVKVIGPGDDYLNKTEDIQTTLSTIMTVNAEGIVGFPTEEGASVAPVVGSNAISQDDLGKTFGVASSTKVTKLSLKPTAGGAYIVEETTDLATNTKTEVRRFKNNVEEAQQEIKEKSVPKTTARTIANSDQVQGVKAAPLTINGTTPSVMPNGVTQIKVEPGVVYRTPDGIVDELAEMAANDKWHETNIDRFYRDYEKYLEEYQKGGVEFTNENIPVIYKNENGEVDFRNDSFWRVSGAAFRMPLGAYDSFAKKVYDNYKKIDKQINAKLSDVDRSHTELGDSESYREQTLKAYAENKAPEVPDKLLDSDWYVKNKMLQASLVDSSPRVTFDKFQADTLGAVRRELREKGYDNLSPEMKSRVDMVDSYFSQTQTNDMVLYRGETLTDYAKNLQPGDKIDSSAWSFMSPSRGYTKMYRMGETTADRSRTKGGVLYRYHTKAGQPIFYSPDATFDYDANNEMVLPRGINATVTSVKDNKLGEVFGEFTPQKIVDVEVEVSGVATGDKVQWGDGASVIDEIYRRNGGAVSPVSPEAFDLPTELYGTDIDGILRLAAWSKANGYGAIPFKTPVAQTRTIKKFSMQDKFVSKLADKYNFPEIDIRDNADGTPYNGPIEGQGGGVEKITERVRTDEIVSEPNNFLVTQYGVPYGWFSHPGQALQYASEIGERRTYEVSPDEATLERPPVTTDEIKLLMPVEPLEKLSAGGYPTEQLQRFNDLMATMPTLESPEDYTRGIIDIVHQVQQIYNQVAMNIDISSLYENYGRALAEGKKPQAMLYEQEALRPLTQVLDALGHYFDPSGKSLTQEFYLPTALKPDKKISIIDAIMGRDGVIDEESPVDGGLSEILLDPLRVGDAGFWQKRTGDLFRDSNGNFTMAKSGTLEDALIAYTVSALTRGKNKLYVAAQNEVARSKFDKNRSQITSKQAMAMLKDADTLRTKTKTIQANAVKDAEAIADLKKNCSGDESAIDEAIKAKNYADELNYTNSLNTIAQKGGYNQNLQMSPIAGSAARFGTDAGLRGISNIRRKMSRINVTGTMYVYRPGSGKVNIGFGLEAGDPNFNIYGHFYPEKAVNLGDIVNKHYDSDMAANLLYERIRDKVTEWTGQSWALKDELDDFVLRSFPLAENFEWWTARAEKIIARAYNSYGDSEEKFRGAVVKELSAWIRRGTLDTFNNAIMMSNISNLDTRTINALDEAAAYMLVGTPVKRAAIADFAQWLAVTSKLSGNFGPTIGNSIFEPTRIIEQFGIKIFLEAWGDMMDPRKIAEAKRVMSELPSRFTGDEAKVGLAKKAKNLMGNFVDKATELSLFPTEWSEAGKNLLFYFAAKRNAELMYPGDEMAQLDSIINNINDSAIAGGRGTTPGIATGSIGQTLNIFKTFTWRNIDDFIERIEQQSRGEGDSYKWKKAYEKHNSGRKDKAGRNKFDPRIAARLIGGRLVRSYLLWLFIGAYFGKSYMDVLGGDPTGITDDRDRGLYDDPETDANEGMTPLDYIINKLPGGPIFSVLQDYWFALRRRGVENGGFLAGDIDKDQKFMDNLGKNLPLGVAKNRFSDMLSLLDRGYSFTSTGRKTYAAPDTALDAIKGFLFGKSTTANSIAYGKYRYGMVDIWGDLSSGDWMDFAMNANPLSGIMGSQATFDTTRKDYTGVFNGSWNDISTMQLIVQQFRERQQKIIDDYQRDKYRYTGDFAGLTDEEKIAKAKENRNKAIDEFTNDVVRAVDEFEKAGNALNDNQITNLMYLFDFHEGEEDDEWNSSAARQRYVEAGLPDYNAGEVKRVEKTEDGNTTEETQGILERSLVLKNAEQGYYGAPKAAANALKDALKDFKSVYKDYNSRVKDLNSQYFAARNKNKKSSETKRLSQQVEDLQNEYLDKLYTQISPVVEQYGTALIGTYDSADVLQEYMGNMIPYSSIKEYGQTYSGGNDIVYGQLTEWLQKRWGRNAPTAPSDREVTDAISNIRRLLDQGKKSQAKDRARATLERIGRGSLGARREDVETLRGYLYD